MTLKRKGTKIKKQKEKYLQLVTNLFISDAINILGLKRNKRLERLSSYYIEAI